MRQLAKIPVVLLFLPLFGLAQVSGGPQKSPPASSSEEHHIIGIGFKAGLNFANVTHASDINASSHTGFNAALFYSPSKGILGSYTELAFSRQGYDYNTSTVNNALMLDYLALAQLMAINITKYVQIQFGFRTAYLLNAKADSAGTKTTTDSTGLSSLTSYFNRIDYGFTGGLEIHPVLGLIIGVRYNLSLNGIYKNALTSYTTTGGGTSVGTSSVSINPKNNVIQIFTGWRF